MMTLFRSLEKLSLPILIIIAIILDLAVGAIDYATGREISFFVFYLLPILLVTWYGSKALGSIFLSSVRWNGS